MGDTAVTLLSLAMNIPKDVVAGLKGASNALDDGQPTVPGVFDGTTHQKAAEQRNMAFINHSLPK